MSCLSLRVRWLIVVVLALLASASCGRRVEREPRAAQPSATKPAASEAARPEPPSDPEDWAARVGQSPFEKPQPQPQPATATLDVTPVARIEPASMADHELDRAAELPARHLVYRVSFIVPPSQRVKRPSLRAPAGELHVDVAQHRLRARFIGPGWPVEDGTEVRLRSDIPGVYLFDGMGGRPLPPGQLAGWFQGAELGHAKSGIGIRRDHGSGDDGPGDLLCALLAEWTRQDREELLARCQNGALPLGFHFGLWSAELTAIVPLKLPAEKLRADAEHPPEPIVYVAGRTMIDAADVSHLLPVRMRPERRVVEQPVGPEGAALDVDNRTEGRVVIVIEGVPVGWVRPRARIRFTGFTPGFYHVGASRPFGQSAMSPTLFHIPGVLRFGRADPRR